MKAVRPFIAAVLALALCAAGAARAAEDSSDLLMPGPAPKADVSPEAQAAIQQMLQAYAGIEHYQSTFTLVTTFQTDKKTTKATATGSVKMERPDKLSVKLAQGDLTFSIACDGKMCTECFSGSNKYIQWKAPSNLDFVLGNPDLMALLGDMVRVTLLPLSSQQYKSFVIGVGKARVVGGGGSKATHIQLDVPSGLLDFTIDPKTHLITEAHALPTRQIEMMKAQRPDLGDLKITYDLTQKVTPTDQPLPDDAFSVTPPKGARQASSPVELFAMPDVPPVKEMVDFTLESMTEGKNVQLSDYKGKVILLDFWATWCVPCQEELPGLAAIYKEFADKGLVLWAVDEKEDRRTVADFLKEEKLDIPVVLDTRGEVADKYKIEGTPTLYLIGRDGKVLRYFKGYGPGRDEEVRRAVEDALAAPAPTDKSAS